VDFDLLAVGKKEDCAARLLAYNFEQCGDTSAPEPVGAARRCDGDLAGTTDPRFSIDLNRYLSLENAEDLVGVVVTVQVRYLVRCNRLHLHNQSPQPVLGAGEHADVARPRRKRHKKEALQPDGRC
jgi:hypothetical protein